MHREMVFTGSGSPTFSRHLDADKQLFNTAPESQAEMLQPELLNNQQHVLGNRFSPRSKFSKWKLGGQMIRRSDNHISNARETVNGWFWFPKECNSDMYLLKRVEVDASRGLNKAMERTLYTRLRRRDKLNLYERVVIRGENGEAFMTKRGEGENLYMRNPYKRAMKGISDGSLERREEEKEDARVMRGLDYRTRVMKRGEDEEEEGGNNFIRVMRSSGHGKKYTRVMKEEEGDDVDARLVKRGAGGDEEEDRYVLVMRKAKDTNSRTTVRDLDRETNTRVMKRDQNWMERFLRTTRKQDKIAFTKDMLTRVG